MTPRIKAKTFNMPHTSTCSSSAYHHSLSSGQCPSCSLFTSTPVFMCLNVLCSLQPQAHTEFWPLLLGPLPLPCQISPQKSDSPSQNGHYLTNPWRPLSFLHSTHQIYLSNYLVNICFLHKAEDRGDLSFSMLYFQGEHIAWHMQMLYKYLLID